MSAKNPFWNDLMSDAQRQWEAGAREKAWFTLAKLAVHILMEVAAHYIGKDD